MEERRCTALFCGGELILVVPYSESEHPILCRSNRELDENQIKTIETDAFAGLVSITCL